jgi:hypothetical protein
VLQFKSTVFSSLPFSAFGCLRYREQAFDRNPEIAGEVPEAGIELLEMIHIDEQDTQGPFPFAGHD